MTKGYMDLINFSNIKKQASHCMLLYGEHKFIFSLLMCITKMFPQQESGPGNTKSDDRWEFPRHRLKVFNILGEGCFGQVWRCEALDIDGK